MERSSPSFPVYVLTGFTETTFVLLYNFLKLHTFKFLNVFVRDLK